MKISLKQLLKDIFTEYRQRRLLASRYRTAD
jgi:hypothetical protein